MAGLLLLASRRLGACRGSAFCYDAVYARVADGHAGFLIYELLVATRSAKLGTVPVLPLTFLHHAVFLCVFAVTKVGLPMGRPTTCRCFVQ